MTHFLGITECQLRRVPCLFVYNHELRHANPTWRPLWREATELVIGSSLVYQMLSFTGYGNRCRPELEP